MTHFFIHNSFHNGDIILTRAIIQAIRTSFTGVKITLECAENCVYLWRDLELPIIVYQDSEYKGTEPTPNCSDDAVFVNMWFGVFDDILTLYGMTYQNNVHTFNRQMYQQSLNHKYLLSIPIYTPMIAFFSKSEKEVEVKENSILVENGRTLSNQNYFYLNEHLEQIASDFTNLNFYCSAKHSFTASNIFDCSGLNLIELSRIGDKCIGFLMKGSAVNAATQTEINRYKPHCIVGWNLPMKLWDNLENPAVYAKNYAEVKTFLTEIAQNIAVSTTGAKAMTTHKDSLKELSSQKALTSNDSLLEKILIVSHKQERCGVYQYGVNITEALKKSTKYSFIYAECSSAEEFFAITSRIKPSAVIYNYHPSTMRWLRKEMMSRLNIPHIGIIHEVTQQVADLTNSTFFQYHIAPDPTLLLNNPIVFKTSRLIPSYINKHRLLEVPTIGSFGFGLEGKGFEQLISTVQQEFNEAVIKLHIPLSDFADPTGYLANATAKRCQGLVVKPGIRLILSHEFFSKKQLLDFLAQNTLNAFFYERYDGRGISSVIDYALAVQRPIAITKSSMFRHILSASPSICIEDSSLQQIINNGIAPLLPFQDEWSEANFILDYERIIDTLLNKQHSSNLHFSSIEHSFSHTETQRVGYPQVNKKSESASEFEFELRELNLIIFPDWEQPEELLYQDLGSAIKSVVTHPDKRRMTLLIDTSNIAEQEAVLAVSSVVMNLLMEKELDVDEGPEISIIGQMNEIQWEALLTHLYARIVLENENQQMIAESKVGSIPLCSLIGHKEKNYFTVGIPNVTSFNRILDNAARLQYKTVIDELFTLVPDMMLRKIPEANIQQAFVLDAVQKFASQFISPKILCVGSFEDTAAAGLKQLGYQMEEIDPALNYDLNTYFHKLSIIKGSYDVIFSTSVLEHVQDDELFMTQIVELLAPGGTAILTCDYNDLYKPGDRIPQEDFRFYTQKDLVQRILPLLKNCSLVGIPQWNCPNPDFTYAGCQYTFATFIVQKNNNHDNSIPRTEQTLSMPQALDLAMQQHQVGNLQEAEIIYRKLLEIVPNNHDILTNLAALLFVQNKHEDAIQYINEALQQNPSSARARAQQERMLYVMKRAAEPDVIKDVDLMRSTISEMKREIALKQIYMPSAFWTKWASLHEHLLSIYGVDNFKRTVGHQYQNWFMTSIDDPQVRRLIELWPSHSNSQPLFNSVEIPNDVGFHSESFFPFYHLSDPHNIEIYKLAVGLLWEYTLKNDSFGILNELSESPIGNPIQIIRYGKLISSDLSHSVRERNNILNTAGLSGNENLVIGELGAGHGRLAEVFGKTTNYRYIIFDIPPTLYVSQWYIKNLFPHEKVFEFRTFSDFSEVKADVESSRFAFFTANQIELLPEESLDIFININSLMEMRHEQIHNFLHHINRLTRKYFFSQQWYRWENVADNMSVSKENFQLDMDWKIVYEKPNEIYSDFFVQIWKKSH